MDAYVETADQDATFSDVTSMSPKTFPRSAVLEECRAADDAIQVGAAFVPVDSRPFGVIIVFTIGDAVLAAVLSLPLAALAACQSTRRRPSEETRDDRATTTD